MRKFVILIALGALTSLTGATVVAAAETTEPAGAGHTVLSRIHSGSSSSVGNGARECCVPGI